MTNFSSPAKYFNLSAHQSFLIGAIIFTLMFFAIRLPFLQDIELPYAFDDAVQYTKSAKAIYEGQPFTSRTPPGYPAFLAFSYFLNKSIWGLILMQLFTSFLSSVFLLYCINRRIPKASIYAGILLGIFVSSMPVVHSESAILTESLYVSLMMIYVGFTILAIGSDRSYLWAGVGLAAVASFLIRPVGIFIIALLLLHTIFLLLQRSKKSILYLWGPAVILFLLSKVVIANQTTVEDSVAGRNSSFFIATNGFWETDESYPLYLNEAILETRKKVDPKYFKTIETSWNTSDLTTAFFRCQKGILKEFTKMLRQANRGKSDYVLVDDYKRVGHDAIRKHPDRYVKWVWTWFAHYFKSFSLNKRYTYPFLKEYKRTMTARVSLYYNHAHNKTGKIFDFFTGPKMTGSEAQSMLNLIETNGKHTAAQKFSIIHGNVFGRMYWVYLFFATCLFAIYKLIRSKFKDQQAYLYVSILGLPILMALTVALVHNSFIRYSFPLSFIYFLSLIFLIQMIDFEKLRWKKKAVKPVKKRANTKNLKKRRRKK